MKREIKRFALESLGCAKNQVDSEIIIASLEGLGFQYTADTDLADLLIINTCGFIGPAKEESLTTCLDLRARYPEKKIVLAGCLAQRYGRTLEQELPEIDGFFACRNPAEIGELIENLAGDNLAGRIGPTYSRENAPERTRLLSFPGSTYVKIADGCDNRCSYCAIPLIKGGLKSRRREDIVSEIEQLLERGIIELNLVAQDLGSYGRDRGAGELTRLLQEIARLKGDFWVRLLYVHPDHFPRGLTDVMKEDPRFLPYFDIPFQHADSRILRAMGRKGGPDSYLNLIARIREELADAVIRSTFLVGFPGEDKESFSALLDFQEAAELDWLGVFPYSREEDTPAYSMKGRVKKTMADKRKADLERRQIDITEKRMNRFVDRSFPVLIEEPVIGESCCLARGYMHAPEVDGLVVLMGEDFKPGTLVRAHITKRNGFDLEAVVD